MGIGIERGQNYSFLAVPVTVLPASVAIKWSSLKSAVAVTKKLAWSPPYMGMVMVFLMTQTVAPLSVAIGVAV